MTKMRRLEARDARLCSCVVELGHELKGRSRVNPLNLSIAVALQIFLRCKTLFLVIQVNCHRGGLGVIEIPSHSSHSDFQYRSL
jgi:hypothetical protein